MHTLSQLAIGALASLHVYILVLEMFFWDKPVGEKSFGTAHDFAVATKALAANQGLYNGFLAAGLVWALIAQRSDIAVFFLACVLVAGVYGAITAKLKILFVQAVPATIALALVFLDSAG